MILAHKSMPILPANRGAGTSQMIGRAGARARAGQEERQGKIRMSGTTSRVSAWAPPSAAVALLPLIAVVLVLFLITGMAIPALPLHVHQQLGLGTFFVGLVSGSQFAASLISRIWSGRYADRRGARPAVIAGLVRRLLPASSTCSRSSSWMRR